MRGLVSLAAADLPAWNLDRLTALLRLMDDQAAQLNAAVWKSGWREFLRMSNILQFADGAAWVTSLGLQEGIYGSLTDLEEPEFRAKTESDSLLENIIDEGAKQIARAVRDADRVLPDAGYELTAPDGEIVAVAELGWPDLMVCVLSPVQDEFAETATALGWTVFSTEQLIIDPQSLILMLPMRDEA